ncbi:MAG: ATP-binding protein [Cyanobacteria bacterium J06634_5]
MVGVSCSIDKLPAEDANVVLIDASPTKNFFVEMLTRDIELKDAILDLLDNCIDGIQRTTREQNELANPYEGFWAKIRITGDSFKIEDNCGGIPYTVAENYAFRMGKPEDINDDDDIFTIGTYGIGMKRALFKMGRAAQVFSQTESDAFEVNITPDWLIRDNDWQLPLKQIEKVSEKTGTTIQISNLRDDVKSQFDSTAFQSKLANEIEEIYSYIISKGFKVFINNVNIKPRPFALQWEGLEKLRNRDVESIAPYLYEAKKDDVEIELAVGFYRQLPEGEEIDDEESGKQRSRDSAGWTIICNDRVVVSHDKTRLTGWGEAGLPGYHAQFIAISGTVHFKSKDARKLPITTTKRGIDASSDLYLYVKDRMREGLKVFTSYTNKWKRLPREEKQRAKFASPAMPAEMFDLATDSEIDESQFEKEKSIWRAVKSKRFDVERRYIPNLPMPPKVSKNKRIIFSKPLQEIKEVSAYIFENPEHSASEVGEACFVKALEEAQDY